MPSSPIKRYLEAAVREDLKGKMVFVGGPRQVGKTTFGLELLSPARTQPIPDISCGTIWPIASGFSAASFPPVSAFFSWTRSTSSRAGGTSSRDSTTRTSRGFRSWSQVPRGWITTGREGIPCRDGTTTIASILSPSERWTPPVPPPRQTTSSVSVDSRSRSSRGPGTTQGDGSGSGRNACCTRI